MKGSVGNPKKVQLNLTRSTHLTLSEGWLFGELVLRFMIHLLKSDHTRLKMYHIDKRIRGAKFYVRGLQKGQ